MSALQFYRFIVIVILSMALPACISFIDIDKPLELIWDKSITNSDSLIIFLPGLYDTAEDFKDDGFFLLAREHGIKADLVAASVHVAHFLKGKVTERINKDIFQLIDKEQYKNIWIVGLSLGGLNSLLVLKKFDNKLCGVITLAPYLLNKKLTDEFEKEENSKGWMPSLGAYNDITEERIENVLVWLRTKADRSKIYIGYGDKDVYVSGQEMLASLLINKNSIVIKGKHNWETGKKIWKQQLLTRQQTGLLQPCY